MMFTWRLVPRVLFVALFLLCGACASDSDDNENSPNEGVQGDASDSQVPESALAFSSQCGTVVEGNLVNPATSNKALRVQVLRAADSNLLVLQDLSGSVPGEILVKLHGIGSANARQFISMDTLESIALGEAYYFPASERLGLADGTTSGEVCTVQVPGGVAATGQLFKVDGSNVSEEFLASGFAGEVDQTGPCGEELLAACYNTMREANLQRSAGEITDFLWKPEAESEFNKGNPVIHVNPCNATVFVNGEALNDFGPGNGRCNTSRMFRPCGAFGSNIKVEVIDNATGLPYYNGQDPFVIVPNGCQRFEFKR